MLLALMLAVAIVGGEYLNSVYVRPKPNGNNAGTQPLQNLAHMNAISAAAEGADGRAIGKAAIAKGLLAAEQLAARNRDPRFCVGAHTSVADLCIIPQLYNARRFGVDLAVYPRLLQVKCAPACFGPPSKRLRMLSGALWSGSDVGTCGCVAGRGARGHAALLPGGNWASDRTRRALMEHAQPMTRRAVAIVAWQAHPDAQPDAVAEGPPKRPRGDVADEKRC